MPYSGGGGILTITSGGCPAANAFLARTSGLDGNHISAYQNLICGMVTDGLLNSNGTSNFFDILYIFATQDATTAGLNLVSSSFGISPNGSPTFTTDRGYTGVDSSTTVFLDTNYAPFSNATNWSQNAAHISAWSVTGTQSTVNGGELCGLAENGFTYLSNISPYYSDNTSILRINENSTAAIVVASSSAQGHWIANRSGASATQGYKNGSSIGTSTDTSGTVPSITNVYVLARNRKGVGAEAGTPNQVAMMSMGADLVTAGLATAFYNRLRTYMSAVGVP